MPAWYPDSKFIEYGLVTVRKTKPTTPKKSISSIAFWVILKNGSQITSLFVIADISYDVWHVTLIMQLNSWNTRRKRERQGKKQK